MKKKRRYKANKIKKAEQTVKSEDKVKSISGQEPKDLIEQEHSVKHEKSTELEQTEETVELNESEKPEETVELNGSEKTEETAESNESEKTEETAELNESEKSEETAELNESEKSEETVESTVSGKSEESEESTESGKSEGTEGSTESGKSEGTEESTEPNKSGKMVESTESDKPEVAEDSKKSEESEETVETTEKKKIAWKKYFIIVTGSVAGTLLVIYITGIIYFRDKFLSRTMINGISASHCTVMEAEELIAKKLSKYRITLAERGGAKEVIRANQINYQYIPKGEVSDLQKSQNIFAWPINIWQETELYFSSDTTFNVEKLKGAIKELRCFDKKVEKASRDAYLEFHDTSYRIIKEDEGKKVDYDKLCKLMEKAVANSKTEIHLEKMNCYERPKITGDDVTLNRLEKNLNRYTRTNITYKFGENTEVLNGAIIKDWLSFDDDGNVTLDEAQIPAYVAGLAEKYDTYDRPRNFRTNDNSYVTVEGGHYGWKIDQELEARELLELIRLGVTSERTANFAQVAVSWDNSDLGDSYVEIDLTRQHLWMYVDGQEIVSSDFVSGDLSRSGRTTPPGTFTLYYKKSPSVLRSTKPGDSYETPVTYWMPFNGGIGMHDANWRWSFGGEIYFYNGSHGCINLPTDAARSIYELIYAGFPIICFYR